MEGRMGTRKKKGNRTKTGLIIFAGILAITIIVLLGLFAYDTVKNGGAGITAAIKGVSVNKIDISGMKREQALQALSGVQDAVLHNTVISIKTSNDIIKFTAKELGMDTDFNAVLDTAFAYGNTGSAEQRKLAADSALKTGMDFTVKPLADKQVLTKKLSALQSRLDQPPVDASFEFMPRGYSKDGIKYEPDEKALIKACAEGKAIEIPETITRISRDEMPNPLRYEFYKETKFIKDYIPNQADISRFLYKGGTDGVSVNTEALAGSIMNKVKNGEYTSPVDAPFESIKPAVTLKGVKKHTQLIASWTSSYAGHNGHNRNWNLSKLSGIINGVVIQPGEEWSINKLAGNRTKKSGWLDAPGIENGGYVDQPGGGVCQISSTLYNAAIRSNLEITDSTHHSIISGYIPLGLDATISSGAPDLKIRNNQNTPVYIVSYTNPKDKNVTVEIYGQAVTDPQYKDVILDFSSKDLGSYGGSPVMSFVYNATVAPDGKTIEPGKSVVYAESRPGKKAQTYKHILSLDGTELKVEKFTKFQWKPINGATYVNGPDPATLPPEPSPSQTEQPQPSETVSPDALQSILDDLSQLGKTH